MFDSQKLDLDAADGFGALVDDDVAGDAVGDGDGGGGQVAADVEVGELLGALTADILRKQTK